MLKANKSSYFLFSHRPSDGHFGFILYDYHLIIKNRCFMLSECRLNRLSSSLVKASVSVKKNQVDTKLANLARNSYSKEMSNKNFLFCADMFCRQGFSKTGGRGFSNSWTGPVRGFLCTLSSLGISGWVLMLYNCVHRNRLCETPVTIVTFIISK